MRENQGRCLESGGELGIDDSEGRVFERQAPREVLPCAARCRCQWTKESDEKSSNNSNRILRARVAGECSTRTSLHTPMTDIMWRVIHVLPYPVQRESLLDVCRRTVNCRRPERVPNEGSMCSTRTSHHTLRTDSTWCVIHFLTLFVSCFFITLEPRVE